jgi:predicted phosphoadenosine phosphosulfate sulfurtransferase
VEWDSKFQLVKINPLADWTAERVWEYIRERDLPYNPLHDLNYPTRKRLVRQGFGEGSRTVSPRALQALQGVTGAWNFN